MFSWRVSRANAVPVRAFVSPVSTSRATLRPNVITLSKRCVERNACANRVRARDPMCAHSRLPSRAFLARAGQLLLPIVQQAGVYPQLATNSPQPSRRGYVKAGGSGREERDVRAADLRSRSADPNKTNERAGRPVAIGRHPRARGAHMGAHRFAHRKVSGAALDAPLSRRFAAIEARHKAC